MTRETSTPAGLLLGEIETYIAGLRVDDDAVAPEEAVLLEREPKNKRDSYAIRVKNREARQLGYLPRSTAAWLAPLLDAGLLRLEGFVPAGLRSHRQRGHRTVFCLFLNRSFPVLELA
jgi:SWI/SNF-related matrix-associated actin-dependent regulator of chromatin subfamily A3